MDGFASDRRTSSGFFTVSELANRIGCEPRTIHRRFLDKGCPHFPAGNEVFIAEESFVEWLRENETRRGSESCLTETAPSASVGADQTEKPAKRRRERRDAETLNALPPKKRSTLPPK